MIRYLCSLKYIPDVNFAGEIEEILREKQVYGFDIFRDLLLKFDCDLTIFSYEELNSKYLPALGETTKEYLLKKLRISPKQFLLEERKFEDCITRGEYQSFLDYLKYYNLLDCDLLVQAFGKSIDLFENYFDVALLDKLR